MVVIPPDRFLLARFNALRTELADLAFELECQGRCDAADITNDLRIRLTEFAGELGDPMLSAASTLPSGSAAASCAKVGGALRPD